jgi:hypothetical protein
MKKILSTTLLVLAGISFVHADPAHSATATKTRLEEAVATTTLEVKATTTTEVEDDATTTTTTTLKTLPSKKLVKKIALEDRKVCDIFEENSLSVSKLASTSEVAQVKLKDIKSTLDTEIEKRDTLVGSLKSLFSFKKSDVSLLSEARADVEDASVFYSDLDSKITIEKDFVADTVCEKLVKKEAIAHYTKAESLTKSEDSYRKDLAKKLKSKMSVLSKEIENQKEKTKE